MRILRRSSVARLLLSALAIALLSPGAALADRSERHGRRDSFEHGARPKHGRPPHGARVAALPREHWSGVHGGVQLYFSQGVWYRPWGQRFVVVAPPLGVVVPLLPPGYAIVRAGPTVYFRADDVYYRSCPDGGYIVVEPPQQAEPVAEPADQLFIYPRQGQTETQQGDDRYACHRWANGQTGFDPTLAQGGVAAEASGDKRAEYNRALAACLEGRGYTVR